MRITEYMVHWTHHNGSRTCGTFIGGTAEQVIATVEQSGGYNISISTWIGPCYYDV